MKLAPPRTAWLPLRRFLWNLLLHIQRGFHCADFHETCSSTYSVASTAPIFMKLAPPHTAWLPLRRFSWNSCLHVQRGLHCADFHETHNCDVNCSGHLSWRISSKLDKECRKYGQNLVGAPKWCMVWKHPIPRHLKLLNGIVWKFYTPTFTQIVQAIWAIRIEVQLRLQIKQLLVSTELAVMKLTLDRKFLKQLHAEFNEQFDKCLVTYTRRLDGQTDVVST